MQINFILVIIATVTSCAPKQQEDHIVWNAVSKLPPAKDGSKHVGLAGPVTGIIGDKMLVLGGANFLQKMPWDGGAKHYAKQAYLYQINDSTVDLIHEQVLVDGIAYAGTCWGDDAVYAAGGENETGPVDLVTKISLVNDKLSFEILPPLPQKLTNGSLVYTTNTLYFVGGEDSAQVSDKVYALNLQDHNSDWKEILTLPYPISNAVVVTDQQQKIYILGGRMRNTQARSTIYDSLFEIDAPSRKINLIGKLPTAIAAGTGVMTTNGDILLIGGDDAETFHQVEDLLTQIQQAKSEEDKAHLTQQKAFLQNNHPGFPTNTWIFNRDNKIWKKSSPLLGDSPVTTTALLYNDKIIIPSGETKAGVRTDQILIGQFK